MSFNAQQKQELLKLKNKKILILGLKREGLSTFRLLRKCFPKKILALADQTPLSQMPLNDQKLLTNDHQIELFLGDDCLDYLGQYEIIFKTPGIPADLPALVNAVKSGVQIESQTRLFFRLCPAQIIGVTGTKGKSTTSSLIHHILSQNNLPSRLMGNIGLPALDQLEEIKKNDLVVMELSCHQLADLDTSPHYAVVQNITSEHLDYYPNTKAYCQAKAQITRFQTKQDWVIYDPDFLSPRRLAEASLAQKLPFRLTLPSPNKAQDPFGHQPVLYFDQNKKISIYQDKDPIFLKNIKLKGKHNLSNMAPAIIIGFQFGLQSQQIQKALETFNGLPHRLQYVLTRKGVDYYNDSMATTPEATIAAIKSFPHKAIILLAGGSEKNSNYQQLAKTILTQRVKKVILFPPTGKRIASALAEQAKKMEKQGKIAFIQPPLTQTKSMSAAIKNAAQTAKAGDIVLLSPASASFGLFRDYADRGEQFVREAQSLV